MSLSWLEFIVGLEFIHQPGKSVLAGKKLLKNLIKEANELVSVFTAELKNIKKNRKS